MSNTSLSAVTYNGSRHVYFQEATGVLRRAVYFPQNNSWLAPADARLPFPARNHTPLAGVVGIGAYPKDRETEQGVSVHSDRWKTKSK